MYKRQDIQAHLQLSEDEDTLGSAVSALLLEPWAIKAFWESWGPCPGKAGSRYAVGNLREALLAAARAGQKLWGGRIVCWRRAGQFNCSGSRRRVQDLGYWSV